MMKPQTWLTALKSVNLDCGALRIFRVTLLTLYITLLATLGLLALDLPPECTYILPLAEDLFHSAFRIAAIGVSAGFAADIAARHKRH